MKQVTTELVTDYIDAIMEMIMLIKSAKAKISSKQMKDTKYFAEEVATISKLFTINHMSEKCSLFHRKESNQEVKSDILMAASWKAPATNFSRATLFDRETWKAVD